MKLKFFRIKDSLKQEELSKKTRIYGKNLLKIQNGDYCDKNNINYEKHIAL